MPDLFTLTVIDSDRRRRRPLAEHEGLSQRDAGELAAVYLALGYSTSCLQIRSAGPRRRNAGLAA